MGAGVLEEPQGHGVIDVGLELDDDQNGGAVAQTAFPEHVPVARALPGGRVVRGEPREPGEVHVRGQARRDDAHEGLDRLGKGVERLVDGVVHAGLRLRAGSRIRAHEGCRGIAGASIAGWDYFSEGAPKGCFDCHGTAPAERSAGLRPRKATHAGPMHRKRMQGCKAPFGGVGSSHDARHHRAPRHRRRRTRADASVLIIHRHDPRWRGTHRFHPTNTPLGIVGTAQIPRESICVSR